MNGVAKVIDELGKMIIAKEVIIDSQKEEINKLCHKIETIEQCLEIYEACYNTNASNSKSNKGE